MAASSFDATGGQRTGDASHAGDATRPDFLDDGAHVGGERVGNFAAGFTIGAAVWSFVDAFTRPKVAGNVQAAEAPTPVTPHEIMVKQGRSLPVEYWAHPF
jgi:hypothetical protein